MFNSNLKLIKNLNIPLILLLFSNQCLTREYLDLKRPVIEISIPKSGTHLLMKCLKMLTKKESFRAKRTEFIPDEIKKLQKYFVFYEHLIYEPNSLKFVDTCNFIGFLFRAIHAIESFHLCIGFMMKIKKDMVLWQNLIKISYFRC